MPAWSVRRVGSAGRFARGHRTAVAPRRLRPEIRLPDVRVIEQRLARAGEAYAALLEHVGAVRQFECRGRVVVIGVEVLPLDAQVRRDRPHPGRLVAVHDAVRAGRPGMPARDELWWRRSVSDLPSTREGRSELRCVVVEDASGVRGYARYTTTPGVIGLTPGQQMLMLALLWTFDSP